VKRATRERLRNEILGIMDYADCKSRHRAIINMHLANALGELHPRRVAARLPRADSNYQVSRNARCGKVAEISWRT